MADPTQSEPSVAAPIDAPPPATFFGRLGVRWKALRKRLTDHFAEYGAIAFVVYLLIFATTWTGFTLAIRAGVSIDGAAGDTGSIGAAYVATQLAKPLRILATIALTPFAAVLWDRIRGRGKRADSPELPVEPPAEPPAS